MTDTPESSATELLAQRVVVAGRERWPALNVALSTVVRHVSVNFPENEQVPDEHLADLYLAYACLEGVRGAIETFHRNYLVKLGPVIRRVNGSPAFVDEVQQKLAETLFVAPAGKTPKIAQYRAQGSIGGWLAIAAHRVAMRLHKGQQLEQSSDDEALARVLGLGEGPELAAINAQYKDAVIRALKRAVADLPSKDKMALKMYYLRQVTTTAIGKMNDMSQPTASRWLKHIRSRFDASTRKYLAEELTLSEGELEMVFRMACSQIDLSFSKLLGESTTAF